CPRGQRGKYGCIIQRQHSYSGPLPRKKAAGLLFLAKKGMDKMSTSTTQTQAERETKTLATRKIAVVGCGKMGTILLESFLERKIVAPAEVVARIQHGDRPGELSQELGGIPVGTDNRAAGAGASIVLLCVKPQVLGHLLDEIAPALAPNTLVISIAAS